MKRTTFKILFYIQKTRIAKDGQVPILLRVTGNGMSSATVERYETSYKHMAEFIDLVYSKKDIPITDVDHKFITDYEFYLRTERKCSHNTAVKYLKDFKKIIRIALANDYISKDPFVNIRFKLDEVERDFLEDHEIKAMIEKDITIPRLAQVRDVFVFSIFTGLVFSDLKGLQSEHLIRDNNGDMWIRKARQKTKNMCNIPLLDPARLILEKYKDHPECVNKGVLLPMLCNQKYNAYLKELATICGINKEVSAHTGRHSFVTSVALANGKRRQNAWLLQY